MAPTSPALSVGTKEEVEVADNLPPRPPRRRPPPVPSSKTLIKCEGSSGGPKLRWDLKDVDRRRREKLQRREEEGAGDSEHWRNN